MKTRFAFLTACPVLAGLLAAAIFASVGQNTLAAQTPPDPVHAAHVASGAMPPTMSTNDPALAQQLAELRAKITQLEITLAQGAPPMTAAPANTAMPAMPTAAPAASPAMGMGMMDKMKSGGTTAAPPMAGMSSAAAPAGGMMGMMSQMMGMMDKMMTMGGATAPMPSSAPMPGSGGMGMMGMMDMGGGSGPMTQSALPGFPGASHLYHIGATDFFLDHPQHIALTTEQQTGLNKAKEQAILAKSTVDRAVEQAEQALWTLTAADQPNATQIEAKIREIEKLRGDERLSFIRAVGDASRLLTDEQRKSLTGFAPPAPAAAMPAAGMKDM